MESGKDGVERNCIFCDMITKEHQGEDVLIVTHAGNVRVIDYYFKGKPEDYDFNRRTIIKNGGLLKFGNSNY